MSKQLLLSHVLLCLLIHSVNSAGILPQYGLMPAQDFLFDMCAPTKPGQQNSPWPVRVDDLCSTFQLNDPNKNKQACEIMGLLKLMLASPSAAPLKCQPDGLPHPPETDPQGVLLPLPLPDLRGASSLPEVLNPSQTSALLKAEGPSQFWLFKYLNRLAAWAPCQALGKPQAWEPPPGWQLIGVLNVTNNLKPYKLNDTSLPFTVVLRQSSSPSSRAACRRALQQQQEQHTAYITAASAAGSSGSNAGEAVLQQHRLCSGDRLLVLSRGTGSAHEWLYNLNYSMVPDGSYGQGEVHSGFHNVTEQIWQGGLQQLLQQQVVAQGDVGNVMFAGHSLGGGVSALLAAKTQKFFAQLSSTQAETSSAAAAAAAGEAPAQLPLVTAVMFGAPNVGDAAFAADFNARINGRNVQYIADVVPQLPCAGYMALCSDTAGATTEQDANALEDYDPEDEGSSSAGAEGSSGGSSGGSSAGGSRGFVSYVRLGGQLRVEAADMPLQQDAWQQLSRYRQDDFCDNMSTVNALAQATHICSYMCLLSHTAGEAHSWCMLWPVQGQQPAANATFCKHGFSTLYPMQPPFPPMT